MSSGGGIVPLNFLQKLHIYQTRSRIYVLGFNKRDRKCSVLKLNRQSAVLDAVEDTSRYTVQECNSLLRRIHEGNSHHGGLQYLCKVGSDQHAGSTVPLAMLRNRLAHCHKTAQTTSSSGSSTLA
jgi:hypothetical protein